MAHAGYFLPLLLFVGHHISHTLTDPAEKVFLQRKRLLPDDTAVYLNSTPPFLWAPPARNDA